MIQFIRYSDNPAVQVAATKMVANINPLNSLLTVGAIVRELSRQFGDYARDVRIRIH
jgi:hypothetical protein